MICPADPYHITLNDILKSGTGTSSAPSSSLHLYFLPLSLSLFLSFLSSFIFVSFFNYETGDVMVGILTDMNCFWLYENRENLVSNEEQ